jgi:hypothetical protein
VLLDHRKEPIEIVKRLSPPQAKYWHGLGKANSLLKEVNCPKLVQKCNTISVSDQFDGSLRRLKDLYLLFIAKIKHVYGFEGYRFAL